jgi:hypothetical protein
MKISYGCELEWGDIKRNTPIPFSLGSWEHSETDIVNLLPPYKYICADPLGVKPPVGGEINTRPTWGWEGQIAIIKKLIKLFESPTISCLSHLHIHAHVPGLVNDINKLHKLMKYIKKCQHEYIRGAHQFTPAKDMTGAVSYMKLDGGRPMPDWMIDNILTTDSFESFIKMHCAGKDGVTLGRPFRYAINTYCLKHIQTVEFRFFRGSLNLREVSDCFKFVEDFMHQALGRGKMLDTRMYMFPPMLWSREQFDGWTKTKYGKERGKKERRFYEAT